MGADSWASDAHLLKNPEIVAKQPWRFDFDYKEMPDNTNGGFQPDGDAGFQPDGGFSGDFAPENISQHASGDFDDAPSDGGCRHCGEPGHFARDCPDKPANSGECYNCGETGHNKADCPNPRVEREFTGECRGCGQTGHRAADCPERGPMVCKICKQEGHVKADCNANRLYSMIAGLDLNDVNTDQAWSELEKADREKDVDDVKQAIVKYAKSFPAVTLTELETTFRDVGMNTHLIAKEQEISDTHTIVNLQGETSQKFVVSFQWSSKPKRAKFAEGWPSSPEENLARLAEAGFVMDGLVLKCSNCNEIGHISKKCEQEKNEAARIVITCANCNEEGHRARDCTQERKSGKKGCRNCGSTDHIAKDCTEPRDMSDVECKNCNETGHFSRDCPNREPEICRNCKEEGHRSKDCTNERVMQCRNCDGLGHVARECPEPKNMAKVQCRNCDEFGHQSRECPKPTDWSRVECTNCKEKGHSYKRCTNPAAEAADAGGDGGWENGAGASSGGGGGGRDSGAGAAASSGGGGGWENTAPAPTEASDGW